MYIVVTTANVVTWDYIKKKIRCIQIYNSYNYVEYFIDTCFYKKKTTVEKAEAGFIKGTAGIYL